MNNIKGLISALIAVFLWGIHGPAVRFLTLRGVDVFFICGLRYIIGFFTLSIFLNIYKKNFIDWQPEKIPFKRIWKIIILGITLNSLFFHWGLKYISASLVMILENLAPMFIILLTWLILKEKPTRRDLLALFISFTGLILIIFGKDGSITFKFDSKYLMGVILEILAGLTFGYYIFISGEFVKKIEGRFIEVINFMKNIFFYTSIFLLPFLITYEGRYPNSFIEWFWIFELGIFQSGLAYLLWNYSLVNISANKAGIIFYLTVFFTVVNETLFLNLKLNFLLIIGGILIISGSFITLLKTKKV